MKKILTRTITYIFKSVSFIFGCLWQYTTSLYSSDGFNEFTRVTGLEGLPGLTRAVFFFFLKIEYFFYFHSSYLCLLRIEFSNLFRFVFYRVITILWSKSQVLYISQDWSGSIWYVTVLMYLFLKYHLICQHFNI
jgi:hypothetical protein